ncbi:hypothetical protein K3740_12980 [Ruegeria conchae]|uniref:hypothetical protein n=1 Tax=Ruegeria conchae TaxID=981384 RepID=UPI0021A8B49A|nr:hypothetical protein [Ruegeria conchae]UWR01968.1 hypothetical protein K3740_12980 [Ruegeria conchae]
MERKKKLLVLTDTGGRYGYGHVMRCLNIVEALDPEYWEISFAAGMSDLECFDERFAKYRIYDFGASSMQQVASLPTSDWVLLDSFAVSQSLEIALKATGRSVFVIDGMLRPHDVDVLLDPIERPTKLRLAHSQFATLLLSGPRFAAIDRRFSEISALSSTAPTHIGVSMGSAKNAEDTDAILQSLERIGYNSDVHVVGGFDRRLKLSFPIKCSDWVANGPEHLSNCSAVIGTCGMSAWERCAAGVPSLSFQTIENQKHVANALAAEEAGLIVRDAPSRMMSAELDAYLKHFIHNSTIWERYAERGRRLCDGLGSCRIAQALEEFD